MKWAFPLLPLSEDQSKAVLQYSPHSNTMRSSNLPVAFNFGACFPVTVPYLTSRVYIGQKSAVGKGNVPLTAVEYIDVCCLVWTECFIPSCEQQCETAVVQFRQLIGAARRRVPRQEITHVDQTFSYFLRRPNCLCSTGQYNLKEAVPRYFYQI
jgi:hypothetical protein